MELYGNTDTKEISASHVELFFEMMKKRKKMRKDSNGSYLVVADTFVHKVMKHVKRFI
jgi:hypothetical protein